MGGIKTNVCKALILLLLNVKISNRQDKILDDLQRIKKGLPDDELGLNMNFGFGWDYGTQGAAILQVGLMLEVLFMRSKTKCFLNLYFFVFSVIA